MIGTLFILEDILRRIEIYDDSSIIDETFGFESSSFTFTAPHKISQHESKDTLDELSRMKSDSESEEDIDQRQLALDMKRDLKFNYSPRKTFFM